MSGPSNFIRRGQVMAKVHGHLALIDKCPQATGIHPAELSRLVRHGYVAVEAKLTDKGRAALAQPPAERRSRKAADFGLDSVARSWVQPAAPTQKDTE